tara:strand:- start:224 stop:451 length:228 start_codon:yes stop_codon:yes gene_type:complete
MKKAGRPSSVPKKLKDGFYISVSLSHSNNRVRIMRDSRRGVEEAKVKYKNRDFQYLGEVKNNFWIDGENKGSSVN